MRAIARQLPRPSAIPLIIGQTTLTIYYAGNNGSNLQQMRIHGAGRWQGSRITTIPGRFVEISQQSDAILQEVVVVWDSEPCARPTISTFFPHPRINVRYILDFVADQDVSNIRYVIWAL